MNIEKQFNLKEINFSSIKVNFDETRLIVIDDDRKHIFFYDKETGVKKDFGISSIAISPISNNICISVITSSFELEIWNFNNLGNVCKIKKLEGHESELSYKYVTYSNNGKLIAAITTDNTINIWDTETCTLLYTFHNKYSIQELCFSPDDNLIAVTTNNCDCNHIQVWNIKLQRKIASVNYGRTSYIISSASFSSDGKYLLASFVNENKSVINIWSVKRKVYNSGKKTFSFPFKISSVSFNSDSSKILIVKENDKTVEIIDSMGGNNLLTITCDDYIQSAFFNHDSTKVTTVCSDGTLTIWDISETLDKKKQSDCQDKTSQSQYDNVELPNTTNSQQPQLIKNTMKYITYYNAMIFLIFILLVCVLFPNKIKNLYDDYYSNIINTNYNIISVYDKVETQDSITYTAYLPGFSNSDVKVNTVDDRLNIDYNPDKIKKIGITNPLTNIPLPNNYDKTIITIKDGVMTIIVYKKPVVIIPINVNLQ